MTKIRLITYEYIFQRIRHNFFDTNKFLDNFVLSINSDVGVG